MKTVAFEITLYDYGLTFEFQYHTRFFASSVLEPGSSLLSTKVSPDLGSLYM